MDAYLYQILKLEMGMLFVTRVLPQRALYKGERVHKCTQQMCILSTLKMYQIQFWLGLCPGVTGGAPSPSRLTAGYLVAGRKREGIGGPI